MILLDLFLGFLEVGCFSFGGAYAAIPLIQDVVLRYGWLDEETLLYFIGVCESTPGPVSVNCATFTGYRQKGVLGAIAATAGLVMPSFIVIFLISLFLDKFLEYPIVANAFTGIKIGVGFLVLEAALGMMKKLGKDKMTRIFLWGAFAIILLTDILAINFSTITMMVLCAGFSLAIYVAGKKKGGAAA